MSTNSKATPQANCFYRGHYGKIKCSQLYHPGLTPYVEYPDT